MVGGTGRPGIKTLHARLGEIVCASWWENPGMDADDGNDVDLIQRDG